MAKSLLRIKSRKLRIKGKSIKEIADLVKISKSTVSLWCRDIELTKKQIENLLNKQKSGLKLGQVNAALAKRGINKERIAKYSKEAKKKLEKFSQKEFLICGLALYLAEGAKKERRIKFINSDPKMIGFMFNWFKDNFRLPSDRFVFSVIINEIHKNREMNLRPASWSVSEVRNRRA